MLGKYESVSLAEFCQENNCSVWLKERAWEKKQEVFEKMKEFAREASLKFGSEGMRYKFEPYRNIVTGEIKVHFKGSKLQFDEKGERQLFLCSMNELYCLSKEEDKICFYKASHKKTENYRLWGLGEMEIGNEMGGFSKAKERMASFFEGRTSNSITLLLGEGVKEKYPCVYNPYDFGFTFYPIEDSGMIRGILNQKSRKYAALNEREKELLSYPDLTKETLLEKGVLSEKESFTRYFLQQLTQKEYRLSLVSYKKHLNEKGFIVVNKIFLYLDEKGKAKAVSFVRDTNGEWVKTDQLLKITSSFPEYIYISEENTGFLKYILEKDASTRGLFDGYNTEAYEKILSLDGISLITKKMAASTYLAFPKKGKIDEAFGLAKGHLHILDGIFQIAKEKNHSFINNEYLIYLLKKIKVLAKDPRMARINNEDFKKVVFLLLFQAECFETLEKVYKGKELFEKTMDVAKDVAKQFEERSQSLFDELLQKDKFFIRLERRREELVSIDRWAFRPHSLGGKKSLFLEEVANFFEGSEGGSFLDRMLHSSYLKANSNLYSNIVLVQRILFFDPTRKEALRKYIHSFHSNERLDDILREGKNREVLLKHGWDTERFYKDFLCMIPLFSPEEIQTMEISLKPTLSPEKIIQNHDRLKKIYELRKNEHLDEGIAKAKETNKKLEYASDDFILTMPGSFSDLAKEGTQLGHCVATYGQKVAKGQTKIFFVHKKEEPEKPYFTVELLHKRIHQIQGANLLRLSESMIANADEEHKKVYAFLSEWAAENGFVL